MKKLKGPPGGTGGNLSKKKTAGFILKLYIAGNESNSLRAVEVVKEVCQQNLGHDYDLRIIDVFKDFKSALQDKVLVAPTLVWLKKGSPAYLIGNFTRPRLLEFLGLPERAGGEK